MDYASVVRNGGGGSGPRQVRPKPIARPASPAGPNKPTPEAAGPFGALVPQNIIDIATLAGPSGVCNLGVSCLFLKEKLLNKKVWALVADQVPNPRKPVVRVKLEAPGSATDIEGEDDAVEVNEGVISAPLAHYQTAAAQEALAKYWIDQVGKGSKTLGGGFVIEYVDDTGDVRFYTSSSIGDVHQWLNGVTSLIEGSKERKITLSSGPVVLKRYGKGGSQLYIKIQDEKVLFDLVEFVIAIKGAANKFLPLASRLVTQLKNGTKGLDEEATKAYLVKETAVKNILQQQNLDRAVKGLKRLLESSDGGNVTEIVAQKKAEKARSMQQATLEYKNMLDFVRANLPPDFEEARANVSVITQRLEQEREDRFARRDAERAAKKAAAEAAVADAKNAAAKEEEAKKNKPKKVKVTSVDKDGFVTTTVKVVGAPEPKPEPVKVAEPAEKGKKKGKGKKGKTEQKQVATKAAPAPSPAVSAPKAPDTPSKVILESNPFLAALREGTVASADEVMHKKNVKKGRATLQQKGRPVNTGTSKPPPLTQKKPTKTQIQDKKKQEAEERRKAAEKKQAAQAAALAAQSSALPVPLPVIVAGAGFVALVIIYNVLGL